MEKNKTVLKKIFKYFLLAVLIGLVAYKSVYFKKLSEVKSATAAKFDAAGFSKKLWEEKLPAKLDSATALTDLLSLLKTNREEAFSKYSNALGIGNIRFFLVKTTGAVAIINEDDMIIQIEHADSLLNIRLTTEFVYGNAIRDASGLVDIKDFTNTMNLNNISEELNKTIRNTVIPPFKTAVKKGNRVELVGAIEMNKEHINTNELELIPARLKIVE